MGGDYVQVLGLGTDNNSAYAARPSVHMFFNLNRFLFNCGEGLQRFAEEHKVRSPLPPMATANLSSSAS